MNFNYYNSDGDHMRKQDLDMYRNRLSQLIRILYLSDTPEDEKKEIKSDINKVLNEIYQRGISVNY